MKESYFTPETIDGKAGHMLWELESLAGKHREELPFDPQRSALLILDMQRFFLDKTSHAFIPSATAIVPRILKLAAAFAGRDLPVILTRHLNTKENAGLMETWWNDLITVEEEMSEIIPEFSSAHSVNSVNSVVDNNPSVKQSSHDHRTITPQQLRRGAGAFPLFIEKSRYDAFMGTRLESILKERNIKQLVITGVMTHLCCETTARTAFMKDFQVFFPVDGTATYNEGFHRASLLNLSHGFAVPVLVRELLEEFEDVEPGESLKVEDTGVAGPGR